MRLFTRGEEVDSDDGPKALAEFRPDRRAVAGLVALAALTFAFVLPILWMTTTSFQAGEKMFQLTTEWIPSVWHPENYSNALSRAAFPRYFLNSGIVSIVVMAGNVVFCTLAGYGLAKFRFPGDRFVLLLILEHADAAARSHAGADVPGDPQVRAGSTPIRGSPGRC